jgi:hypothetical protein
MEHGRNFAGFRFVELSSVCLLVMAATEHRLVAPSNVLILSLVISLLLSSRPVRVAQPQYRARVPEPQPPYRRREPAFPAATGRSIHGS